MRRRRGSRKIRSVRRYGLVRRRRRRAMRGGFLPFLAPILAAAIGAAPAIASTVIQAKALKRGR